MKITLKNIKYMASLSEETNCYTATLYVDGKKVGEVGNRGHGGPDEFHGDREAYAKAEAWVKENHPPLELGNGDTIPADMEIVCGEILETHLLEKDLKKHLKKSVLMIEEGATTISVLGFKGVRSVADAHIKHVEGKYPKARVLNTMPFDEALELFKTHT